MAPLTFDGLPGSFVIERGESSDYRVLEHFHYIPRPPATWAGVWRITYINGEEHRVVGIGVLSFPSPHCRAREKILGERIAFDPDETCSANPHVRTISRVIVHPQFRSLGLATALVRRMCAECPTRFVETLAMMARVHPLFEKGGMQRVQPEKESQAPYYFVDRGDAPAALAPEPKETPPPENPTDSPNAASSAVESPLHPDITQDVSEVLAKLDAFRAAAAVASATLSPTDHVPQSHAFTREQLRSVRSHLMAGCSEPDHLHLWIQAFCGINVPRHPVCAGHDAPFDYIARAYFEPSIDQVVWAPRGGGKTRLAALATLLDLLHKPFCQVRILGGSLDQSLRMWEHLLPDVQRLLGDLLEATRQSRQIRLKSGSAAAVLAQSQRAVRGLRVQKLRCDEVELFDPRVWEAAQLATKSRNGVRGTIEAMSTLHKPWGLMNRVVESATAHGTRVTKWCIMEVLERCPPERDCNTCKLEPECGRVAKTKCNGFFSIDDAITLKGRVSPEQWDSEMLCKKPSAIGCVFPTFRKDFHVIDSDSAPPICLALDFGFSAPFVCLWIAVQGDVVHVIDEYVQPQQTVDVHLVEIESRRWGKIARVACDPAGAGRNEQTAESNIALLRRKGYLVRHRASRIIEGVELIRAGLRTAAGETRLFIHRRCQRLIKAMEAYHYPEGGGELPAKDGEHDHLIDALRYFYVNRLTGEASASRRY